MFGLTKKDLEVFFDVAGNIVDWALDGFDPMVPFDDYGAGDGGKPSSGGGFSQPADARPTQVGPVGETPTTIPFALPECNWCNPAPSLFDWGENNFPIGTLCDACRSWATPEYGPHECWECGSSVPAYIPEIDSINPEWVHQRSSGDRIWQAILTQCDGCKAYSNYKMGWDEDNLEGWTRADDQVTQYPPENYKEGDLVWEGDVRNILRSEKPNYDAVESWETPKAKDFMVNCITCNGTGKAGTVSPMKGDKAYIVLQKDNKYLQARVAELEKQSKHATNSRDANYCDVVNESEEKYKAMATAKRYKDCLDRIHKDIGKVI